VSKFSKTMHHLGYRNTQILLFLTLFIIACKSKKTITPTTEVVLPPPIVVESSQDIFLKNVTKSIYTPSFFNGKATISTVFNGNAVDFDAVIQFRKDSAILIVAKKFGFEAGRALITPDSFYIINRMEQQVIIKPLSAASQKLGLPPRFDLIQDVIMGNPLNISDKKFTINLKDSLATLTSSLEKYTSIAYLDKQNAQLYQNDITVDGVDDDVILAYKAYKTVQKINFSHERSIDVESKKNGSLSLDITFSGVEFNVPKVIRFDIPKRFKKLD
jgi:Domain of unknown function (DUF4292)